MRLTFSGTVAEMIKKTLNADIPYVPWLTGYLAIAMGAVLTFIVQSSSVFTTTLTPLVGVGLISVERVYPLTLGSNLGTTTTAMIASLAAEGSDRLRNSLQIALCHFFFNFTGILLFYPIPFMRWPLVLCKILGRTTAQYRYKMTNTINLNFPNSNRQVKQNGKKAFISFTLP
jgi:sodium-dependent phosphate cotransporter